MSRLVLQPAVRTHAGLRRSHNEDHVFGTPRLIAVADGVGGAAAGEVASGAVIATLASLEKRWLSEALEDEVETAIREGNERIAFIAGCRPEYAGMGTTLTAVAIEQEYVVANIGDSRTYLYRDGVLTQLTRDDSVIQELLDSGMLDPVAARRHPQRSVVLQALDGDPSRRPSIRRLSARAGDRLLVCSDGLSDVVENEALAEALRIGARDTSADRLLALALEAGAPDNVSIVVADVAPAVGTVGLWRRPTEPAGAATTPG
jgi:serine/threonine protein phosphatase PrpC